MNSVTVKNTEGTQSVPSIYLSDEKIEQNAMDAIWLASLTNYFDF